MFCPKCGNELNEGAAFCPKCGQAVNSKTDDSDDMFSSELNEKNFSSSIKRSTATSILRIVGIVLSAIVGILGIIVLFGQLISGIIMLAISGMYICSFYQNKKNYAWIALGLSCLLCVVRPEGDTGLSSLALICFIFVIDNLYYNSPSTKEKKEAFFKKQETVVKRNSNAIWIVIIVILIAIIGGLVYSSNSGKSEKKTEYVIRDDATGLY